MLSKMAGESMVQSRGRKGRGKKGSLYPLGDGNAPHLNSELPNVPDIAKCPPGTESSVDEDQCPSTEAL